MWFVDTLEAHGLYQFAHSDAVSMEDDTPSTGRSDPSCKIVNFKTFTSSDLVIVCIYCKEMVIFHDQWLVCFTNQSSIIIVIFDKKLSLKTLNVVARLRHYISVI